MYRVTEGLQREKQSLMKQLDLLRYNENTQHFSNLGTSWSLHPLVEVYIHCISP